MNYQLRITIEVPYLRFIASRKLALLIQGTSVEELDVCHRLYVQQLKVENVPE